MDVNRTTLPGDFAMMEKAGLHFKVIRSRQNKYYFDGRLFDIPELKVRCYLEKYVIPNSHHRPLINAVSARVFQV